MCVHIELWWRKLDREINDIRRIAHSSALLLRADLCSSKHPTIRSTFAQPWLVKRIYHQLSEHSDIRNPQPISASCIDVFTNVTRIRDPLNSHAR